LTDKHRYLRELRVPTLFHSNPALDSLSELSKLHAGPGDHRQRVQRRTTHAAAELGRTFRSAPPKYPTEDPDDRILRNTWPRFTHFYFYLRDEGLGPLVLGVGSFLPFQTTYYLNGHHCIEVELRAAGSPLPQRR
jgi:hypothetical protein